MKNSEQTRISAAVWPWQASTDCPAAARKKRIQKAVRQTAISTVIGLVFLFIGRIITGSIILAVSGIIFISGIFIPRLFSVIETAGHKAGHWIAIALTWFLLVPFFFLCFVPGRLILKLRGTDPLHRKPVPSADSYWIRHPPVKNMDQYRKQHS